MSTLDVAVFAINGAIATLAVGVNLWAAFNDDTRRRPVWAAIGFLAAIFVAGYAWVLHTGNIADWSRVFRGISPLAWLLPWCWPAWRSTRDHHTDVHLVRQAEQAAP